MTTVGQIEKRTQARIVALFHDSLHSPTPRTNRHRHRPLSPKWTPSVGLYNNLFVFIR